MLERDVLLIGEDEQGQEVIELPVTRLGNIEDGAEVKETPSEEDFVPVLDNGKMKKTPFKVIQVLVQQAKQVAEAAAARVGSLEKTVNGREKLTGEKDPAAGITAQVGQRYLNIKTGEEWECVAVDENGTKWEKKTSSSVGLTAADVGARPSTWTPTASDVGAVPTDRKVNGKALSGDISLTAADVGARPSTWMPTAADVGAAAAGHTHTASDVGAKASTWVPYVAGTTAPSDKTQLWIDTTASTGGLKYWNGSAWKHVPVAYT